MKTIGIILGLAFTVISGVMISLVVKGGALKPAGVIKPAEIGNNPEMIGKQIAVRLFPDFQEAKQVIWRIEGGDPSLSDIARVAFAHYRSSVPHRLVDLLSKPPGDCAENCWYLDDWRSPLPDVIAMKIANLPTVEVFVQYFDREEKVPASCDAEKILEVDCLRPISVREVRRKLKTPAPHYFMQRYKASQFYLFIERV